MERAVGNTNDGCFIEFVIRPPMIPVRKYSQQSDDLGLHSADVLREGVL